MRRAFERGPASVKKWSPFVPSPGQLPPFLAGRGREQERVRELLDRLADREQVGNDLILYGPRGNGKTALMEWALRKARARGVGTLEFSSEEVESKEWLAQRLSALPPWIRLLSGVSALGFGVRLRESGGGPIVDALARKARKRPLLLAIDEAHTLAIDVGRALLHAVQRLRRMQFPVMLLLAGTPDLRRHLHAMGATFWERSEILRMGLLNLEEAGDAIRIPMEAEGRSISADALTQVVAESHGYPYFLQLWGQSLWNQMQDPARPVSLDAVDDARSSFEATRDEFYLERYDELAELELAYVAGRLSVGFAEINRRTRPEVNELIGLALERQGRASDRQSVKTALEHLRHLGYIWPVSYQSRYYLQPGIPSLMRFVAKTEGLDGGTETS